MKAPCTTTGITSIMAIVLAGVTAPVFAGPLPTWDIIFNTPQRFRVLDNFNGEAVFDKETGLVWQRSPSTSDFLYIDARFECDKLILGGRMGWRLPKIHELTSLIDPNVGDPILSPPALPAGHPFLNVGQASYWSGSLNQVFGFSFVAARLVNISANIPADNFVGNANIDPASDVEARVWCVRAPGSAIESSEQ